MAAATKSEQQAALAVLFGQTDTLRHSMNEAFRRSDNIQKRAKRAFKATEEHTMRAMLEAKATDPSLALPPRSTLAILRRGSPAMSGHVPRAMPGIARPEAQRGVLDVRRTMRANVAYDGNLFELAWRRTKIDRPKLIVLCDVSGSVAAVSRFFLMFLYSLDEVMPKTRSFVFSNRAGEITDVLQEGDLEEAMENALKQYGGGSTDYGMSMMDLAEATLDAVDKKTTLMVLGDARSNYGDPGHLVLKEFYERAGRVIFLNPEPETVWDTGDSEMKKLGAYCTHKQTCNSVKHVERVLDDLLRLSS